jgi:hypothetical protein
MKRSEEWARKKLTEYLTQKGVKFSSEEGENPPDFVFVVEGEKWAVEVTELHQYIDVGREKSTITIEHRLLGLFRKIDRKTASRSRGYVVSLKGPYTREQEQKILSEVKNHILDSGERLLGGEYEVTPLKIGNTALEYTIMVDGTTRTPDGNIMIADIQESIDYALGRILSEKVIRLSQFALCKKRVLVMVSEYFFADCENVRIGLQKRSREIAPIDEIYLAWNSSFEILYP